MFGSSIRYNIFIFLLVNVFIIIYFAMKSYRMEVAVKNHIDQKCEKCHRVLARLELSDSVQSRQMLKETYQIAEYHQKQQQNVVEDNNKLSLMTTLYVITPTFTRGTQKPDLTRLAQTLMLVPKLHWLVVEDAASASSWVEGLLVRSGITYTHMFVKTPAIERRSKVRGCSQRNEALKWIKQHAPKGVIYFADDDNAYDIRLFEEIRTSTKIGIVPTGNLAKTGISSPVVKNGKIIGFVDVWKGGRKFPIEMASMGINIEFWLKRGSPLFSYKRMGYLETRFLEAMKIGISDLEPKANDCTKVYTWHTNTLYVQNANSYTNSKVYKDTNIPILIQEVDFS